jgi:tetratricopeptide (TPR) repeat protein
VHDISQANSREQNYRMLRLSSVQFSATTGATAPGFCKEWFRFHPSSALNSTAFGVTMVWAKWLRRAREGVIRFLAPIFVLLLILPLAGAQLQTESSGNCDLYVSVRAADESSIDSPIQVDLSTARGWIATVHITGGDPAQFRVNNGRTYRLTVSGNHIETTTTSYFEINPLESLHTETIRVKPKTQAPDSQSSPSTPTISVSEMNIPKKAHAAMRKGLEAYAKGDMQNATDNFERAITEYPHYARAYDMLGAVAIKASNRARAKELFLKAIEADNAFLPAYLDLARFELQDQNYAESESLLTKAIAINPSAPEAAALLTTAEFMNKEYDKAFADVERTHSLAGHEQFAEVHLMAGKVLRIQNRPAAAVTQFQLFLIEKPDSPQGRDAREALASLTAQRQP